jgi:hypothetical protein
MPAAASSELTVPHIQIWSIDRVLSVRAVPGRFLLLQHLFLHQRSAYASERATRSLSRQNAFRLFSCERRWRASFLEAKAAREMTLVGEPDGLGDISEGHLSAHDQSLCLLNPGALDVFGGRQTKMTLE